MPVRFSIDPQTARLTLQASTGATDELHRAFARAYLAEHSRAEAAEAERDRLAARVAGLEALTGPQRDRLVELERELEATKLSACNGTPCSIFTEDHLVFSARQALARTAPAADPETGAPVSLGWRIRWLCERVAALKACRIGYASEFPPATKADRVNGVLPGDPDVGRVHENIRALKARVAELEASAASVHSQAVAAERRRVIGCIEDVTGRRISDGGQYRADIRSSLKAWKAEPAAVPVEWREGVPSVADVRAHSEGTWQWHGCYGDKWEPEDTTDHVTIQMIRVIKDKVNVWDRDLESWRVWTPIDGVVIRARPCVDGTPVPWPVHGAEGVADAQ